LAAWEYSRKYKHRIFLLLNVFLTSLIISKWFGSQSATVQEVLLFQLKKMQNTCLRSVEFCFMSSQLGRGSGFSYEG
jgi:hypothetical protein